MNYMRATNFMMLGGLMLGVCVEHSGLHKRIALRIILFLGTSPNMILFGFMVTTAFVSMWISNGATAAMMVPIIDAFVAVLHNSEVIHYFNCRVVMAVPDNIAMCRSPGSPKWW